MLACYCFFGFRVPAYITPLALLAMADDESHEAVPEVSAASVPALLDSLRTMV